MCSFRPGLCSVQTACDVTRGPEAFPATCFPAAGVGAQGHRCLHHSRFGHCGLPSKGRPLRETGGGQERRGGAAGPTRDHASAGTALSCICLLSQNTRTMGPGYDDRRNSWIKLSAGMLYGIKFHHHHSGCPPEVKFEPGEVEESRQRLGREPQGGSWHSRGWLSGGHQKGSLFVK